MLIESRSAIHQGRVVTKLTLDTYHMPGVARAHYEKGKVLKQLGQTEDSKE